MYKRIKHPLAFSTAIAIAIAGYAETSMASLETDQLATTDKTLQEGAAKSRVRLSALQEQLAELRRQNTNLNQELENLRLQHEVEIRRWAAALDRATKERVFLFSSSEENGVTQLPPPTTTPTGSWFINFETYRSEERALDRLESIKDALVPINIGISEGVVDGQSVYRVRSMGYESRNATNDAVKWINQRISETSLWIGKRDEGTSGKESFDTPGSPDRELRYVVFVADYTDQERAQAVAEAFTANGIPAEAKPFEINNSIVHKVLIPDLARKDDAEAVLNSLQKTGSFADAKILKSFSRVD